MLSKIKFVRNYLHYIHLKKKWIWTCVVFNLLKSITVNFWILTFWSCNFLKLPFKNYLVLTFVICIPRKSLRSSWFLTFLMLWRTKSSGKLGNKTFNSCKNFIYVTLSDNSIMILFWPGWCWNFIFLFLFWLLWFVDKVKALPDDLVVQKGPQNIGAFFMMLLFFSAWNHRLF